MYDVTHFTILDMTLCGKAIRTIGIGAATMEEVSDRIVRHFFDNLVDGEGNRACSLIRLFKTHPFDKLDDERKQIAREKLGSLSVDHSLKCLVLLGTVGEETDWTSWKSSKGHQVIPLPSEEAVNQIPMIRNLIKQLGLEVSMVVKSDPSLLLDMEQKTFNVFHVPEAFGSPYIPAQQEFVIPYGIKSVVGFGGLCPSGDIFTGILFLKVPISREIAELFTTLSLNVKIALLPFDNAVFTRNR
jgi:hypothetical protein